MQLAAILAKRGCVAKTISVVETEPIANLVGRLFIFQSEDFPDELNLSKNIPFRQPPHLAFPDHVHHLVALNRPPRSIEKIRKRKRLGRAVRYCSGSAKHFSAVISYA
jgi:hypothetical protein